ncbi:TonB-dependent receptor domain-containing protein [Glacieibacterium frigidum]|uniref:TonB-dependent receptor n=1 Tax=Glacieibacterium frigidum TaxID=2593303 RepID=A0A552U8Y7_9SPHN|nr:TonB-dependent receptor [Glacieibacterium frigidum]TRW14675.1 TonB-dependent receptor [Glacieibacterium frigidum]
MKHVILSATALVATLACLPAYAQTAPTPAPAAVTDPATPVTGPEAAENDDEAIVVTGSRIARAGFDSLEPATVVSSEYLKARGLTNVADALNEIPGFGVGVNPDGGQAGFGVGQNFVNRFGLGSARTLTLVNGRRFVSTNAPSIFGNTPGLQVDLNVIPTELVDRIENVAIGGAPTYGSDAIAGTVNVILKRDFEGVTVSGLGGITEQGDNGRYNIAVVAGHNFGADKRGNITVAASYDKANGVLAINRKRFQEGFGTGTNPTAGSAAALLNGRTPQNDGRLNPNTPFNTGNADGIANTVYIRNTRIFSLTGGGLLLPATNPAGQGNTLANGLPRGFGANNVLLQFDPQGNLVPFNPGVPFGAQNASGGDGFNLNETSQITSGLERITANLIGRYEIFDKVEAFVEATYYRAKANELIDQPIFNATLFGANSAPLTFQATDPRLSAQARAQLAAVGATSFRLSRASRDLVNNNASSTTDVYRIVGGLKGEFGAFGREFTWEASANYGRSEGSFFANVLNQQRFVNAINNCQPATAATKVNPDALLPNGDPNCVPLDVFGENRASPAAKAYVTGQTEARAVLEQQVYNINFGSQSLFELWSGPVGFNVGYEHRKEKGAFLPDDFQRAGLGRSVPIGGNSGQFNTDEAFGEILIPLVSPDNNVPLIRSLQIEGKIRYVDNTVNGGFTAYTYGGRWQPFKGIELRGNYTRSLRAPSITELFTPVSPAFNTFPDPCDRTQIALGPNPAQRQTNCAAFFAAYGINGATFDSLARAATVPITSGGNVNLDNEEGKSYTFGFVLQPSFIPRFRAAVDWNRIKVIGNIASLTNANIAEGCYDNPDFNTADVDNANAFCSLIARDRGGARNGQLSIDPARPGFRTNFVNGAFFEFKGLTAEVAYNFPLDFVGLSDSQIDLNGSVFYTKTLRSSNNNVTINPDQGEIGNPKYVGQLNIGYTQGPVGIDFQTNYQSKAKFNNLNTVESQDILSVREYWTFNLGASVEVLEQSILRFNISNLTDKDPPYPLGTAGLGVYDYLGRRFTVSFEHKF